MERKESCVVAAVALVNHLVSDVMHLFHLRVHALLGVQNLNYKHEISLSWENDILV